MSKDLGEAVGEILDMMCIGVCICEPNEHGEPKEECQRCHYVRRMMVILADTQEDEEECNCEDSRHVGCQARRENTREKK